MIRSAVSGRCSLGYPRSAMLYDFGLIVLTIVFFIVLDRYVAGCDRV